MSLIWLRVGLLNQHSRECLLRHISVLENLIPFTAADVAPNTESDISMVWYFGFVANIRKYSQNSQSEGIPSIDGISLYWTISIIFCIYFLIFCYHLYLFSVFHHLIIPMEKLFSNKLKELND